MLDLNFEDTRDIDYPAKLTENLSYQDLVDSQDQCISVQYNEIDLENNRFCHFFDICNYDKTIDYKRFIWFVLL